MGSEKGIPNSIMSTPELGSFSKILYDVLKSGSPAVIKDINPHFFFFLIHQIYFLINLVVTLNLNINF